MKVKTITLSALSQSGKWRANPYVHRHNPVQSEHFELTRIGDVADFSNSSIEPEEFDGKDLCYIGLENVEPATGNLLDTQKTTKGNVLSRSKVFTKGDVLYGRMRPYLKKVLYIEDPYDHGICSKEFIILKAKTDLILPSFLRDLLLSDSVTEIITRMQSGTKVPRITSKDLLDIKIPVPSLEYQQECVNKIEQLRKQRQVALLQADALLSEQQDLIANVFK